MPSLSPAIRAPRTVPATRADTGCGIQKAPRARRFSSCPPGAFLVPRVVRCAVGFASGGSFERAVEGGDRGSSGLLAPEARPVRRLCPGLPVPRVAWLDDCGSSGADRERFEIRSFDACRRPLMWLVEEWTRHESATSVLVEPLSWGKSRSRDTTPPTTYSGRNRPSVTHSSSQDQPCAAC